ncbi:MAG: 50S ribosomal protein L22 [Patescibacteria group bacterium]
MSQETVKLNNLDIAPRKVRLIAGTLRGLSAQEAQAQLLLRPQRSAKPLLKLLRSALANAANKKIDGNRLFISEILVNQGPMLKRSLPRAQGRATPIQKKMSHIVLTLKESTQLLVSRFVINPPVKKEKKKKVIKEKKVKSQQQKERGLAQERPGFFKRLFRRKSV